MKKTHTFSIPYKFAIAFTYAPYKFWRRSESQKVALTNLARYKERGVQPLCLAYADTKPSHIDVPSEIQIVNKLKRNSAKEIKNDRDLPYIKEMFDICAESCDESVEFIGCMNSDILVKHDFWDLFSDKNDAYIFYRIDIGEVNVSRLDANNFVTVWTQHEGNDCFFFRKDWWLKNRQYFPDNLVFGETEWDTVYRSIIKEKCEHFLEKRCLYHVYHDPKWTLTSPGAKLNISIKEGVYSS